MVKPIGLAHPLAEHYTLAVSNSRESGAFTVKADSATLLAARGPALYSLLARLFRMLANEGCTFNWREMAWFILNAEDNEDRAEEARMGIARAYYQAERRSGRSTESTAE